MKASNLLAGLAAMIMVSTPIAAQAGTRAGDAQVSLTVLSAQAPVGLFVDDDDEEDGSMLLILLLLLGAAGAAALAVGGGSENDSSRGTGG